MSVNINSFKNSFKGDLARPSRFEVLLSPPLILYAYIGDVRNITYRCESAQLPGRTLATTEQKTYGPIEKFPYLTTYTDIDLTFIVDDVMSQKKFFDTWLELINPSNTNNMRYKEEYATDLKVTQYDVTGQPSYRVTMYDAYPISVNQLDLDWSSDSYHKLTVTFAYTYWENNILNLVS